MEKLDKTRDEAYAALKRHKRKLDFEIMQNSEEANSSSNISLPPIQAGPANAALKTGGGAMFNAGRRKLITDDIRDQALDDIKLNPDIFDGTVNRDELRKILSEAARKLNMVNSPNFQPIFNGDYSDYVVDRLIADNKLSEFATAKARNAK